MIYYLKTNGLKALYFQEDETQTLSTRGVKVMCSTCTVFYREEVACVVEGVEADDVSVEQPAV